MSELDVDRLLRLWTDPPLDDEAVESAFRDLYNDPVSINGEPVGIPELIASARRRQQAFEWPDVRALSVVESARQVAVVYRLRGRQVGDFDTVAGPLPRTGRVLQIRMIDVLTLADGRIREVWSVANELGALSAVDAVCFAPHARLAVDADMRPWEIGDEDDPV